MIAIVAAESADRVREVRALFVEYAASLPVDLAYQQFEHELASLPGDYSSPFGCLRLALDDRRAVGCVGVRPLADGLCEMKRLYVRPNARGLGVGRRLAVAAIDFARAAGHRAMRLDTLPTMTESHALYRSLGFREIAAYRDCPVPGNLYMELPLSA